MITELHTVALYVTDQDRAKRFYVETLGFDVNADQPGLGGIGRWLEVAPRGGQTAFMLADAAGWKKQDRIGRSADVTLRCDDARALHAQLTAKGVPVTDPQTQRFGTFIDITDPDGHRLRVVDSSGRTISDRQGAEAGEGDEMRSEDLVSVRYMVDDVDDSIGFYTRLFGFELRFSAAPAFAEVVRRGLRLLLAGPDSSAGRPMPDGRRPHPGGWNRIHFVIDDIAGEVQRLREAGVHFRSDIITGPGGSQVVLDDPSGNPIELFQPASTPRPDASAP